jgi:hypothetical protein
MLCLSGLASCSREIVVVAREVSSDVAPIDALPPPGSDAGPAAVPVVGEPAVRDASADERPPDADISEPVPDDDEPGRDFDND